MNTLLHKVYKLSLKLLKKNLQRVILDLILPKFHKEMCIQPYSCVLHFYRHHIFISGPTSLVGPGKSWNRMSKQEKRKSKKKPPKYNLKSSIKAYLFRTLIFATTEAVLFIYISCGYFSKNRRVRFGDIQTKSIS